MKTLRSLALLFLVLTLTTLSFADLCALPPAHCVLAVGTRMAHIRLDDVGVDLPVFGAHSRSLKNRIISAATGGRLAKEAGVTCVRAHPHVTLELNPGDRVGLWGHNRRGQDYVAASAGWQLRTDQRHASVSKAM